jgi:hypothetical protein
MRARAVLTSILVAGLLGAAPAWADHDCGNGKSHDGKDKEKCRKDDRRGHRPGERPPPPPREEWTEAETARTELRFAVELAVVADDVPDRYQVAMSGGRATVVITARSFQTAPDSTAVVHEASVLISAPDASAGVHAYLLWQVTDIEPLAAKMRRTGLPVHVLAAPYTTTSAGVAARLQADVALNEAAYSFTGSVEESAGASTGSPNVVWYDGSFGTVRASTTCSPCGTPGSGAVVVSTDSTSRVSTYLSAEAAVTPASFVRSSGVTVAQVIG